MTKDSILVATICGLLTAVLFLLPLSIGSLGMFLSTFAAAPLFVSALGFGTLAGIVSGLVAAVVVTLFHGPLVAIGLTMVTAAPAIWMGHLAGLVRDEGNGPEWFPISEILMRMALVAAVVSIGFGWITGYDPASLREQLTEVFMQVMPAEATAVLSPTDIGSRIDTMVGMVPYVFPVSVLFLLILNMGVAERFVRRRGWMLRPKEDYAQTLGLPVTALLIFAVALAASFLPGATGMAAKVATGALGGAFGFVGLATIHVIARTLPSAASAPLLGVTYFALLLSRFFSIALAALGLLETLFGLRARFQQPSTPPSNT